MIVKHIAVGVVFIAIVSVIAHADTIGVYNDTGGTDCNISDDEFPIKEVYVVHVTSLGATASEWSAPIPACWTNATWLSDTEPFSMPGNSQTGKSVGYGTCMAGPGAIHILTINYFVEGSSPPCCPYPVLPASWAEDVLVVDCNNNLLPGVGLTSTINGDETCPCGYPVPVEETTWGKIKVLYTE
ncbi:MAG: hypothetical protein JSW58_16875 [Candidatus Latescibacterota bacterium]|nr:MAG: hypothetical protein JSW58_16875 [Candidatus Latescibacterota bacterium]